MMSRPLLVFLLLSLIQCVTTDLNSFDFFVDQDKIIQVDKNDGFNIKLKSSYGNGSKWNILHADKFKSISLDSTGFIHNSSSELNKEHQQSYEVFYFKAVQNGFDWIEFAQQRPWDKENSFQQYKVKVIVE